MNAEGGCDCRALRYRLTRAPLIVHACHCRDCRRLTGSAYAFNAWIEKEFVELLSGTPVRYARKGGSGTGHDVYFCGSCGTTIYSDYLRPPGSYWWVRVGTLDDPDLLAPDVHIFTRSQHRSVVLPEGVPAFRDYYERGEVWPAESLARMEANVKAAKARPR
jgi:hypothetical protein